MSDREIMNAKNPPSAREILEREYPTIYNAYKEIADEADTDSADNAIIDGNMFLFILLIIVLTVVRLLQHQL